MKKALIITLLVIVTAIVAFFVYSELTVKELFFVSNFETNDEKGHYSVKRLYSSDVDMEALNEKLDNLISLEFTEEEIMQAALDAGTPEFYPAFHFLTYRPSYNENEVIVALSFVQELSAQQRTAEYSMSDIHLEIMADGVLINEVSATHTDDLDRQADATIIKNEAGTGISADLGDYGDAELKLSGTSGNITIQCSYDIKKNSLIKHLAVEKCFIMVQIGIVEEPDGKIKVSYRLDPSTTLDEYNEQ